LGVQSGRKSEGRKCELAWECQILLFTKAAGVVHRKQGGGKITKATREGGGKMPFLGPASKGSLVASDAPGRDGGL